MSIRSGRPIPVAGLPPSAWCRAVLYLYIYDLNETWIPQAQGIIFMTKAAVTFTGSTPTWTARRWKWPTSAARCAGAASTAALARCAIRAKDSHGLWTARRWHTSRCAMPGSTLTVKPGCIITCSATTTRRSGGLLCMIRIGLNGGWNRYQYAPNLVGGNWSVGCQ